MSKLIKEILDALNAVNQNKTQPFDRQGEVKRIEGKIAWVKLEGSDRETPIQMTIACDVGDTVQARIGGGSAWLTGNLTAPPTDDKKANEAISMVTTVVQEVQEQVEEALEEATDVEDVTMQYCLSDSSSTFTQYGDWSSTPPTYVSGKYYWVRSVLVDDDGNETYGEPRYSQDTQLSVETSRAYATTNAHFWYDSTGAYVTDSTQTDYKASASNKYATRVTPTGIIQSYSGNLLSAWTSSGIGFYAGDGTTASTSTPTASFGSGGINLYGGGSIIASFGTSSIDLGSKSAGQYMTITSSGLIMHKDPYASGYDSAEVGISTSSGIRVSNNSYDKIYVEGDCIRGYYTYGGDTQLWKLTSTNLRNGLSVYALNAETFSVYSGGARVYGKLIASALNNSLFSVTSVSVTTSSGTDNLTGSASASNTGYYPLCVAGLSVNTGGAYSRGAYLSSQSDGSCTVNLRVYNGGSSGAISATVYVLWLKTTA